ncbi:MAG: DUF6520 family protein [Sediminicola sp.]
MNKLKFILPLLAFVMAIGLSFAFADTDGTKDYYATKYILVPGGWATIDVECPQDNQDCTVTFAGDPSANEYRVYNSKNLSDPTIGNGISQELNGPVPNPDPQF